MSKGEYCPVAIVGMGSIFPKSGSYQELWQNVLSKVDCTSDVPESLINKAIFSDDPESSDKAYCNRGGLFPGFAFDPVEFGIPPKVMESISVQQLAALVVARNALLDANIIGANAELTDANKIGVILGSAVGSTLVPLAARLGLPELEAVMEAAGVERHIAQDVLNRMKEKEIPWTEDSFPGYLANITAGRISNRFGFQGPNFTVDAACASSLCAIDQSISELKSKRCDVVLTGGVNISTNPLSYVSFSQTPAFSKSKKIMPYDEKADGLVAGDGVGMLVLKRLEDAVEKNNRIYAVIRGIGSSSDGRAKSIYAPNFDGQLKAIQQCYLSAKIDPSTVELIEGHGTGTEAGDIIEVSVLKEVFKDSCSPIALGSVKSQIGHTRIAAGSAGVIKTALALYNKILPPTINVDRPNSKFQLDGSPIYINTECKPWIGTHKHKRRAGVSAFGFGGTNYHLVLEEYEEEHRGPYRTANIPEVFVLSESNKRNLIATCNEIIQKIRSTKGSNYNEIIDEYNCDDIDKADHRIALVATDYGSTLKKLEIIVNNLDPAEESIHWEHPVGIYYRNSSLPSDGKVVAVFSGQGHLSPGVGQSLCVHFPQMRSAMKGVDTIRSEIGQPSLSQLLYPAEATGDGASIQELLNRTANNQPAMAAFCSGLYSIFSSRGFLPDIVFGHSFGELTSLWAAGYMDLDTLFQMSIERGKLMEEYGISSDDSGAMIALDKTAINVQNIIDQYESLLLSSDNSSSQIVLAGPCQAVRKLKQDLSEKSIQCSILPIAKPFHTKHFSTAGSIFEKYLNTVPMRGSKTRVISNYSANFYGKNKSDIVKNLSRQIYSPVLFRQSIEKAHDSGGRVFVEFGPKKVLSTFINDVLSNKPHHVIPVIYSKEKDSTLQVLEAIARLKTLGLALTPDQHAKKNMIKPDAKSAVFVDDQIYRSEVSKERRKRALYEKTPSSCYGHNSNQRTINKNQMNITSFSVNAMKSNEDGTGSDRDNKYREAIQWQKHQSESNRLQKLFLEIQLVDSQMLLKLLDEQNSLIQQSKNSPGLTSAIRDSAEAIRHLSENKAGLSASQELFFRHQLSPSVGEASDIGQRHHGLAFEGNGSEHHDLADVAYAERSSQRVRSSVERTEANANAGIDTEKASGDVSGSGDWHPPSDLPHSEDGLLQDKGSKTVDRLQLATQLIEIISEKTGYPKDIISSDMNLEADLGIDSIKRVEVFSALNEAFPGYFENTELNELAELVNIDKIVDKVVDQGNEVASARSPGPTIDSTGLEPHPAKLHGIVSADEEYPTSVESTTSAAGRDSTDFSAKIVKIVADKTGYPEDIIDVDMDMEADLGIDSIKRVEIFSAINEGFPGLFENMELGELAEFNTIEEIASACLAKDSGQPEAVEHGPEMQVDIEGDDLGPVSEVRSVVASIVQDITGSLIEHADGTQELDLNPEELLKLASALNVRFPEIFSDQSTMELGRIKKLEDIEAILQAHPQYDSKKKRSVGSSDANLQRFKLSLKSIGSASTSGSKRCGRVLLVTENIEAAKPIVSRLNDEKIWVTLLDLSEQSKARKNAAIFGKCDVLSVDNDDLSVVAELLNTSDVEPGIDSMIYVASNGPEPEGIEKQIRTIRKLFLVTKHFFQVVKRPRVNRSSVICVTRMDGRLGYGENIAEWQVQAGLHGFVRALKREWPDCFCRSIDISRSLSSEVVGQIFVEEMQDGDTSLVSVGRDGRSRVTLFREYKPRTSDSKETSSATRAARLKDRTYIVTGGARGITAQCVCEMAKTYPGRYVLVGRTDISSEEPEWAEGCEEKTVLRARCAEFLKGSALPLSPASVDFYVGSVLASREIKSTMSTLERLGIECMYLSCNVTEKESLYKALESLPTKFSRISGLIHGAGNIADKKIQHKSARDFDRVVGAKVIGLDNLLRLLPLESLEFMCLFCSASAYYGQEGQTDYAFANEYLSAFAGAFKAQYPNCIVHLISWGPWEGGMVNDSLIERYQSLGIVPISLEKGAREFVQELSNTDESDIRVMLTPVGLDELRQELSSNSVESVIELEGVDS